jgi:hypothetical protein
MGNDLDTIIPISFTANSAESDFYYAFDFSFLEPAQYQYYFEVFDNDYLHNYKSVQSEIFNFKTPEYIDLQSMENERIDDMESLIKRSNELSEEIRYQLDDFKKSQINNELTDWQKEFKLDDINNKRKELEETIEKINSQNRSLNNLRNSFAENSLDIVEKQKELEKLIDEIFSDEIKELMDKLNELSNNFDEGKFEELKKRIDYNLEDFEKQLDRNLQMMKRMHIEQKIQLMADKIDDIATKQKDIAKNFKDRSKSIEEVTEDIKKEKSAFDSVMEDMDDIVEKNKELKSPIKISDSDSLKEEINNSYKESMEELKSGNKNKSVKNIEKTNKSINKLADKLRNSLKSNGITMNLENIDQLKAILSNLVHFSFAQEDILYKMNNISSSDPELLSIIRSQDELSDIKLSFTDSLYSIADRTPQIGSKVYSELLSLDSELERTMDFIENGKYTSARVSQQTNINSVNNIALFIDEIIDQINDLLENSMPGDGEGEGKGQSAKFSKMKAGQKALKKQLEEMIKQMESGKGASNEQLGKALMQQEMLKSLMNDIMMEGGTGNKAIENLKNVENLIEQNIKDFVNNNIGRSTLLRQNSIFKHLLDAENAEMKRGLDDKRESVSVKKIPKRSVVDYFDIYSGKENVGSERIDLLPIKMNHFYKRKYKSYKKLVDE